MANTTLSRLAGGQRVALIAVQQGAVRIGPDGTREAPAAVPVRSLNNAYVRGWWEWPHEPAWIGDTARLTQAGREALK